MLFMPDVYCFNCQATKSCCPTYLAGLNVMKPTQKALRENTCAIASGDYSTPVSQRGLTSNQGFTMLYPTTVLYIFI